MIVKSCVMRTHVANDRNVMEIARQRIAAQSIVRRNVILILLGEVLVEPNKRPKGNDLDQGPERRIVIIRLEMPCAKLI